jgi:hypothetical protein
VVAIVAVVLAGSACAFFVYVLVQFRRDEKHPRRHQGVPAGFPMAASGQIVGPLRSPERVPRAKNARQNEADGTSPRRDPS